MGPVQPKGSSQGIRVVPEGWDDEEREQGKDAAGGSARGAHAPV